MYAHSAIALLLLLVFEFVVSFQDIKATKRAAGEYSHQFTHFPYLNVSSRGDAGASAVQLKSSDYQHLFLNNTVLMNVRDTIRAVLQSHSIGANPCATMRSVGNAIAFVGKPEGLPNRIKVAIGDYPIMLQSSCFSDKDIGNNLSEFFESLLCSQITGLHYIDVSPTRLDNAFYKKLGFVSSNYRPLPRDQAIEAISKRCSCTSVCHENPTSLIYRHTLLIGSLFSNAIRNYWAHQVNVKTDMTSNIYLSHVPRTSKAKTTSKFKSGGDKGDFQLIPDVSIHYRCGDNLVTHYGFLPFRVLKSKIPPKVMSIYVLSEAADRKGGQGGHERCDAIFNSMIIYLKKYFPSAVILILRGADPFLDMARLTLSKTAICSVSTFCFWPAISRKHSVYFPVTKLIAQSDSILPNFGSSFIWLNGTRDRIVKGVDAKSMSIDRLIELLTAD